MEKVKDEGDFIFLFKKFTFLLKWIFDFAGKLVEIVKANWFSLVINYWLLLTTIYYTFSFSCYTEQKLFVAETITPDNSE